MRLLYCPESSPDGRLVRALAELHRVETARGLDDGAALAPIVGADAVICDLDRASSEVVERFRQAASQAWLVAMLPSSREQARLGMLKAGADAVFCRPYVFRELSARLDVFARRTLRRPTALGEPFSLEPADRAVRIAGERVRLSQREFDLLALLAARAGRVAAVEDILQEVWGDEGGARAELVHTYVARLRDKLERGRPWRLLHGARGHGYRFAVERAPQADSTDGESGS
jgi:DNA-binding response OmpR family regulator